MKKILVVLCLVLAPVVMTAQTWQYTGSMGVVHWDAGMIELNDHTALIVGGLDPNVNPIATCEIYNPATASWSLTGNLNVARSNACLIKLPNGHVLSISGSTHTPDGGPSDVVEEFDPSQGTWTIVGHLQMKRMICTANMLSNEKILIAGGYNGSNTLATCELYDPATNTSSMTGSMSLNRYEHQSTMLADGRIMIDGGRDGGAGSDYFNEVELYDPSIGTWTVVSPMRQSRMEAITTIFSDGAVLAAGGRNAPLSSAPGSEIFDENTLTWSNTDPLKEPVTWMGCILFPDDRYMVTGGIISATWIDLLGLDNVTTPQCEWYDRTNRLWYYAPQLNLSRCRHKAMYLHQSNNPNLPTDFLLVAGGQTGTVTADSSTLIDSSGHLITLYSSHYSSSFTNTAEVLDVTPSAVKTYMKEQPLDIQMSQKIDNSLTVIYRTDGSINIKYILSSDESVSLSILNTTGQIVKQLPSQTLSAGEHTLNIPAVDFASGTYFVRLTANNTSKVFKFFVVK
jgi:hypothetical protein